MAVAAGIRVLITMSCCFPPAVACRAGLAVDRNVESLADGLVQMLSASDERRAEMGSRGSEMIRSRYNGQIIASQMFEVYRWVLGLRDAPQCVQLD